MSESQQYGVLRIVGVHRALYTKRIEKARLSTVVPVNSQEKYTTNGLPEERLVHMLSRRETMIGRALDNDIILLDPTVSREHARLIFDEQQRWAIWNLTTRNTVSVNGKPVLAGTCVSLCPQDYVQIGSTMLQLVAPQQDWQQRMNAPVMPVDAVPPLHEFRPYRVIELHESQKNGNHATERNEKQVPETPVVDSHQGVPTTWHGEEESSWNRDVKLKFTLAHLTYPQEGMKDEIAPDTSLPANTVYQTKPGKSLHFLLGVRMRWVLVVVGVLALVMGLVSLIVLNSSDFSLLAQQEPLSMIGALTIPIIPALGIALLINFIDRYEREPWFLRLAAFLWGAIIAIPPAVFIEQFFDGLITSRWGADPNMALHALLQALNIGVTEETVKGLGLLLLFLVLRDEFDNVTDGIVYGALIGAGFAMVENFFYFADNTADWPVLIVGRIVLGWLCHSTFTVCFGAALGYIRHTQVRWQRIVIPLVGYLLSVGLHMVFDFVNFFVKESVPTINEVNGSVMLTLSILAVVANYIPPFITQIVFLYILMKSLAHEAAVVREFLAPEVGSGVITVEEYALLQNSVARGRAERQVLRQQGFKQWRRVKALYQAGIGLAFRKWHVSMGDMPRLGYIRSEEAYRRRIKQLRQEFQKEE